MTSGTKKNRTSPIPDFGLTSGPFTLPVVFLPALKSRLAWQPAFAAVAALRGRIQSPPGIFLICLTQTPARKLKTTTMRRSEEHTSELQSHLNLVCRLLLEKKKEL